jgi:hypothetical protein
MKRQKYFHWYTGMKISAMRNSGKINRYENSVPLTSYSYRKKQEE